MRKVVIIGAGCAGWTAAIYTSRANLEPLMLTGKDEGGQLMLTTDVENYPGFPDAIKGPELMENMKKQAIKYGTEVKQVSATSFEVKEDGTFEIIAGEEKIQAKSVIISTGADARMLGLPTEKEYLAKGINTCSTCDGFFYKDK